MTHDKDDWNDLSAVWSEPGHEADPRAADMIRAVRRRALWGRLNFWFEVAGSLIATVMVMLAAFFRDGGWPLALGGGAFCAFALMMTVWSRRDLTEDLTETPADALNAATAQARSGVRWAVAGLASCAACALFLVFATTALQFDGEAAREVHLVAGVILLAMAAFYLNHARLGRARLERARAALNELQQGGGEISRE